MSAALQAAVAALREGRLEEGLRLLDSTGLGLAAAFDLATPDPDAVYNAGVGLYGQGRIAEAADCFARVLAAAPDHLPARANRGTALVQLGHFQEALGAFEAALALAPGHPVLLDGKGDALIGLGRMSEARAVFLELTEAAPERADAWNKLGGTQVFCGDLEAALAAFDRAVALDPANAEPAYNRGNVLRDLGRFDEALAAYDRAIAAGDAVNAPINKALLLMLRGDWARGLPLYETRWRAAEAGVAAPLDPVLWGGWERLRGKTLLMRAEQGFGDAIQMLRYVPIAAEAGARVLVQLHPALMALAKTAPGAAGILSSEEAPPRADVVCPMMSLPLLFGRPMDAPGPSSYLQAPAERREAWTRRLGPREGRRIGLAWSGNRTHANDRNRSLPLAALAPVLDAEAEFISLQVDHRPDDLAWMAASGRVRDVSAELKDFSDTAGLIESLDLVIAADTAVAHLAGALGKPVWILLPWVPDFRWGLKGERSPIYPSARLFRQPGAGAWDQVAAEVVRSLRA